MGPYSYLLWLLSATLIAAFHQTLIDLICQLHVVNNTYFSAYDSRFSFTPPSDYHVFTAEEKARIEAQIRKYYGLIQTCLLKNIPINVLVKQPLSIASLCRHMEHDIICIAKENCIKLINTKLKADYEEAVKLQQNVNIVGVAFGRKLIASLFGLAIILRYSKAVLRSFPMQELQFHFPGTTVIVTPKTTSEISQRPFQEVFGYLWSLLSIQEQNELREIWLCLTREQRQQIIQFIESIARQQIKISSSSLER